MQYTMIDSPVYDGAKGNTGVDEDKQKYKTKKAKENKKTQSCHCKGCTDVNIFFVIAKPWVATCCTIDMLKVVSCGTILILSSVVPAGVCGEAAEASDVDSEWHGSGVSGW